LYHDFVYPLDHGYLDDAVSGDVIGVDVWVGSVEDETVTAVICTVDLLKSTVETKLLIGCTDEEAQTVFRCHNIGSQHAILLKRPV